MLSQKGKRPKPLGTNDLYKLVTESLARRAYVGYEEGQIETLHAKFDHPERRIDINDVLHGLSRPWEGSAPDEFDEENWQWKYEVHTQDVDGGPLTIVIAVDTSNRSFEVITRWSV